MTTFYNDSFIDEFISFLIRVLILDFDIHHGDGTQELTYNRKDIMYISMHRFDDGNFFPKDPSGNFTFIGEGPNAGYNVNIPFSGKASVF